VIEYVWLNLLVLCCYAVARQGFTWSGKHLLALPLVTGTALMLAVVAILRLSPQTLLAQMSGLRFLMDLAVVAMAIPLHLAGRTLMRQPAPWLLGLLAAGLGSMACIVLLAHGLGVVPGVAAALLPKAATMPVALGLTAQGGFNVHLTTLSVVITGLAGALWIPWVLRRCGIHPGPVHAFTLGACAHAIGLVRVQADNPQWQHFAIAGMCGNALLTALLMGLWWHL